MQSFLEEARGLQKDDAEGAKGKVVAALALEPDNADAKTLLAQLKGEKPPSAAVAATPEPPPPAREPRVKAPRKVAKAPPSPPSKSPPPTKTAAPVTPAPEPAGGAGSADLMAVKAAAAAYKSKDFAGAAQALRLQAKSEKVAVSQKLIVTAAQVAKLGDAFGRAEGAKGSNPSSAVADYQTALGIDASVGHGFHGAYIKGVAGKTAKAAAAAAFSKQLYDSAFEMAKAAQKLGSDDGGIMGQLQKKAADLVTRAQGMARSNPSGAKAVFQTVTRMVPSSDPSYAKAQQGMASTKPQTDQDED